MMLLFYLLLESEQLPNTNDTWRTIGMGVGLVVAVAVIAGLIFKVKKMQKSARVIPQENRYADTVEAQKVIPERQIESQHDLADLGVITKEKQAELFNDRVTFS